MQDRIIDGLHQLAHDKGVKFLFAVEGGSRAWGMASPKSDYDVRFIYVHPRNHYLKLFDGRDTISRLSPGDPDIEFDGWDYRKALRLLIKSNPSLMEWLKSPTVYVDEYGVLQELRNYAEKHCSPPAQLYHYLHMAKGNYREYLRTPVVRLKKYLYVLRPLLAVEWILDGRPVPTPITFDELLDAAEPEVREEITALLERKRSGELMAMAHKNEVLDNFILSVFEKCNNNLKATGWDSSYIRSPFPVDEVNESFRLLLEEQSGWTWG